MKDMRHGLANTQKVKFLIIEVDDLDFAENEEDLGVLLKR